VNFLTGQGFFVMHDMSDLLRQNKLGVPV